MIEIIPICVINPANVKLAMELRRKTVQEVSEKLGIEQDIFLEYIENRRQIPKTLLSKLVECFKFPQSFFLHQREFQSEGDTILNCKIVKRVYLL